MRLTGFLFLTAFAFAQDAQLSALRSTLETIRSKSKGADFETPIPPELTTAKHQLRDWIETQLESLKPRDDEKVLELRMNEALNTAGFPDVGDTQNIFGTVGEVRLSRSSGLLIVNAGVGILCQEDQSAYAYKNLNGRWHRIWDWEQIDYGKYSPQHIFDVKVWEPFKNGQGDGPAYLLMLSNGWGCMSAWHSVYYRVWRIGGSGSKLLIDGSEFAWLRSMSGYAVGSIRGGEDQTSVDALIEFTERSVDAGVHNREAIRHYLIDGDKVRRVDPVALSPRDFVDEWLTHPWSKSAAWSSSPGLKQWHKQNDAEWVGGEFTEITMHCQTPDLWQVALALSNEKKNFESEPTRYYLVRWRPPYHFTMVDIRSKPWPLCTKKDPEADEWRTLFSTQEWRR